MNTPILPPLVVEIVQTAASAVEGVTFTKHSVCPACGGPLVGYDTKRKQYAHLKTKDDGTRTIYVGIRRFYCRDCHRFCLADNPFYPDTRIGSVVIDLCIALSMTIPVNRVPAYLAAMGILVDRSSCRLYTQHISSCHVRINTRYLDINNNLGIHLPLSVLSLSSLAIVHDDGNPIDETDILTACDFPSSPRKACNFPLPQKRWINRDDIGY
ncbi:MAG TPA: hypothetical protein PKM50_01655 [Methanoregula sp.]|nr:hypothetical protein [Methanoregula sp.]